MAFRKLFSEQPQYDYTVLYSLYVGLLDRVAEFNETFGLNIGPQIEAIKNHLSSIVTVYGVSQKNHPELGGVLYFNYEKLSGVVKALKQTIVQDQMDFDTDPQSLTNKIEQLVESVYAHYVLLTEEYSKASIKFCFDVSAEVAKFTEKEIQEKLPSAIQALRMFCENLVNSNKSEFIRALELKLDEPNKSGTKRGIAYNYGLFQDFLTMLEKNPSPRSSAFFVLLAQSLAQINQFDGLDDIARLNILDLLANRLKESVPMNDPNKKRKLEEGPNPLFYGERTLVPAAVQLEQDGLSALAPKDQALWIEITAVLLDVLPAHLYQAMKPTLVDMCKRYLNAPPGSDEFYGLLPVTLKDAKRLQQRCKNHMQNKGMQSQDKVLGEFSEQINRRHFLMQICGLHNAIFCDNTFQYTENWEVAYDSIMEFLNNFHETNTFSLLQLKDQATLTEKEKRKIDALQKALDNTLHLMNEFQRLCEFVLTDEASEASAKTKHCMIGLVDILSSVQKNNFEPAAFNKVFEMMKTCQNTALRTWLDSDLQSPDFKVERMNLAWRTEPPQNDAQSHIPVTVPLVAQYALKDLTTSVTNIMPLKQTTVASVDVPNILVCDDERRFVDTSIAELVGGTLFDQPTDHKKLQKTLYSSLLNFFPSLKSYFHSPDASLQQIAKSYGLVKHDVEAKGQCMYLAVAAGVKQLGLKMFDGMSVKDIAGRLLSMAHRYLSSKENRQEFKLKVRNVDGGANQQAGEYDAEKNYDAYLKKMLEGDWGDHYQLHAICDLLDLQVVVFSSDHPEKPLIVGKQNSSDIVCVGHEAGGTEGWHFQAFIRPENAKETAPQKVIDLIKAHESRTDYIRKGPF